MKRTELKRKTSMAKGKRFAAMSVPIRDGKPTPKALRATAIKASTKRMKQTRSTDKPTTEQLERWDRMRTLGCIACLLNEVDHDLARVPRTTMVPHAGNQEIHHLTSSGRRRGHDDSICLCRYHHQGDLLPRYDVGYRETVRTFGPSFGRGRATFAAKYGTDDQLLAYQQLCLDNAANPDIEGGL